MMETKDPIEMLRDELRREPLFSERNGYQPLDRGPLLRLLDEIEVQYMRLPVDAGGVPIRPGEEVYIDGLNALYEVAAAGDGIVVMDGMFMEPASDCRHVKPDAVFDILEELALRDDLGRLCLESERKEMDALLANYAERIREAVYDE